MRPIWSVPTSSQSPPPGSNSPRSRGPSITPPFVMNVSLVPNGGGNQLCRLKFDVHVEEMLGRQPVEQR